MYNEGARMVEKRFLLEGKVAIVTGAAQGIGYAIAERFLRERAKVIIADINDKLGVKSERALRKLVRFVTSIVMSRRAWMCIT